MSSDINDDVSILEKIIAEEGSCTWANLNICAKCPFSKLTRYENDDFMSCAEAIGIDGLNEEQADAKYKVAALNKLAEIMLEQNLTKE